MIISTTRFTVMCIPDRDEDAPGWWFVWDTQDNRAVWPECARSPGLRVSAMLVAAAHNLAWNAARARQ